MPVAERIIVRAVDDSNGNIYQWIATDVSHPLANYPGPGKPCNVQFEEIMPFDLDSITFTIDTTPFTKSEIDEARDAIEEVSEMCGPPAPPEPEPLASVDVLTGASLDQIAYGYFNLTRLPSETDAQLRARVRVLMDFHDRALARTSQHR